MRACGVATGLEDLSVCKRFPAELINTSIPPCHMSFFNSTLYRVQLILLLGIGHQFDQPLGDFVEFDMVIAVDN